MHTDTMAYEAPVLPCETVALRPFTAADAPDIYEYARHACVTRFEPWECHGSVQESLRFVQLTAQMNRARRRIDWAIADRKSGRVIGACGVAVRSTQGEVMELGYVVHPSFWGRGIATQAAAAARDFVFSHTACVRLEARHVVENGASGRVMQKIGMQNEGVLRANRQIRGQWLDEAVYALTRADWEAMQPRDRETGIQKVRQARCFALDMDGTIYLGQRVLPGAREFVAFLQARGVRTVFLTNNSSRGVEDYYLRLRSMGFDVQQEDILTSGQAAGAYLQAHYPGRRVFVMGNERLVRQIRQCGVDVCRDGAEVVLAGFDTTLTYETLTRVCDYVRAGLPFVATHPDYNCPVDGGFIPDLGAMLALIEQSAGRRPDVVIGKPNEQMVQYLTQRTGVPRAETVMVGDRLYTDVAAGVLHGMTSVLVLSGETKRQDLAASRIQPDLVVRGVDELYDILREG